jgi:orotidine-5'-phosphate decarboxylase
MQRPADALIFPLDVATMEEAKRWVKELGPWVGMFKVGLELFIQCGPAVVEMIRKESGAGIFLDLKLHDIPATVFRAMTRIAELEVDLTTVHCGESRTMLEAAAAASEGRVRVLAVTVLTSVSADDIAIAGFRQRYAEDIFRLVRRRADMAKAAGLAGIVCSGLEVESLKRELGGDFLAVTPGIRPAGDDGVVDDDQKRIVTPYAAISAGADYLVIGRPVKEAAEPAEAARQIGEEIARALRDRAPG